MIKFLVYCLKVLICEILGELESFFIGIVLILDDDILLPELIG